MIPPIEERAFRTCSDCIFSYETHMGDTECKLQIDVLKRYVLGKSCIYNYEIDEMKELLDNLEK
jgi:hypothetical protein